MLLHESANMEQSVPENLSTHVTSECEIKLAPTSQDPADSELGSTSPHRDPLSKDSQPNPSAVPANTTPSCSNSASTKVKLSFSVDRLLSAERSDSCEDPRVSLTPSQSSRQCCDVGVFSCCTFPSCFPQNSEAAKQPPVSAPQAYAYAGLEKFYPGLYMDYKSVLRPTPIRAAEHVTNFPTMATSALLRFHQQQQQQQQQHHQQQQQQQLLYPRHQHKAATLLHGATTTAAAMLAPLNGLKTLQLSQQQRFLAKSGQQQLLDNSTTTTMAQSGSNNNNNCNTSNSVNSNNHSSNSGASNNSNNNGKRKRSWSRAVFTNLQRKGLEIQFQQQKYITKPDRRKLAARLNLTDAQVKVWFQNRRMKWRHTRENLKSGHEKQPQSQHIDSGTGAAKPLLIAGSGQVPDRPQLQLDYSSDSCSSMELSDKDDDDDNIEIDVVE
ncbi:hypothetical protein KR222_006257 [Zaprionus bogoriensis]|nr:hypothetical protein KR222_006257 [Zaprionus bogoriensis]